MLQAWFGACDRRDQKLSGRFTQPWAKNKWSRGTFYRVTLLQRRPLVQSSVHDVNTWARTLGGYPAVPEDLWAFPGGSERYQVVVSCFQVGSRPDELITRLVNERRGVTRCKLLCYSHTLNVLLADYFANNPRHVNKLNLQSNFGLSSQKRLHPH